MALTTDQDAYFRDRLGSGYDADDAEERLIRLGGDGYEPNVVVEVLRQRLADLSVNPLSFTVVGEYSENRAENVRLIESQLSEAYEEAGLPEGGSVVYIQQAEIFDNPTPTVETEEFLARGGRRLHGGR